MSIPKVGPPVPEHIQRARQERFARQNESTPPLSINTTQAPHVSHSDSESDDDLGPQLPTAGPLQQDVEKAALERLHSRSQDPRELDQNSKNSADRSSWMAFALGQKVDKDNVTYNPKTLRRNVAIGGATNDTWKESETERTKRLADEMMGLGSDKSLKKAKTEAPKEEEEDSEDEAYFSARRSQPTLLEQHAQKREEEKASGKTKSTKKKGKGRDEDDERFSWSRDMKGGSMGAHKVQQMVNQAKDMSTRFSRGSK